MTRRNFLSSVFAGAAALVGVKLLPKEEPKITFGPNAKAKVTETPSKKYTVEDAVWANKPCTLETFSLKNLEDCYADLSGNGRHLFGPVDCPPVVLPFSPKDMVPEEISAIHTYLNKKYGSNLPVSHVAS